MERNFVQVYAFERLNWRTCCIPVWLSRTRAMQQFCSKSDLSALDSGGLNLHS